MTDDQKYLEHLQAQLKGYRTQMQRLLNKVNRVTATHRAGLIDISEADLDALSNRQVEVEEAISEIDRIGEESKS